MNQPDIQKATIITEKKHHFLTDHLKNRWSIKDEWYNFKDFNPDINVLLSLDETSYEGGENGEYHPISWYHEFEGGRSFYTGLGHVGETYKDSRFVKMIGCEIPVLTISFAYITDADDSLYDSQSSIAELLALPPVSG